MSKNRGQSMITWDSHFQKAFLRTITALGRQLLQVLPKAYEGSVVGETRRFIQACNDGAGASNIARTTCLTDLFHRSVLCNVLKDAADNGSVVDILGESTVRVACVGRSKKEGWRTSHRSCIAVAT